MVILLADSEMKKFMLASHPKADSLQGSGLQKV